MTSEDLRCVQRGARLVCERRKRRRIVDRQIREDLSVHFDAGELEAVHERVVVHVVLMRARIDAHDPQTAEITLLVLAIAVRVLPAALDGFLRGTPQLAAGAEGTARSLHDLLFALEARDVAYCTRHWSLSLRDEQALHALGVARGRDDARLAQATLPLGRLLREDV